MTTNNNRLKLEITRSGESVDSPEGQSGLAPELAGRALAHEVLDLPAVETATVTRPKRQVSPETRAKISAAKKGQTHSPETRAKISTTMKGRNKGKNNPRYGKTHSPEARAKISAANKGENNPNYGKILPPETRTKLSVAMKGEKNPRYGKTHSPETRAKMSTANKGEKGPSYDKNIDQIKLAIDDHVINRVSMAQASRNQGFCDAWLFSWKRRHPERFVDLYDRVATKYQATLIQRALGIYAAGQTDIEAASLSVGLPVDFLWWWRQQNPEEFDQAIRVRLDDSSSGQDLDGR